MKITTLLAAVLFAVFTLTSQSHAQAPLVTIDTVTVGDAGNAADTTTYGAVTNVFAIGKYEVTIGQYNTFLNSVASVTPSNYLVNLWNAGMATDLNIAGISRSGSGTLVSPYSYSVIGSGNRVGESSRSSAVSGTSPPSGAAEVDFGGSNKPKVPSAASRIPKTVVGATGCCRAAINREFTGRESGRADG